MYIANNPLTGEAVNMYADNLGENSMDILDIDPVRYKHTCLKREELYHNLIEGEDEENKIIDPKNYNDVKGVFIENPIVKVEDGKINSDMFELILERPYEKVSEEANKITYVSEDPSIIEVDEEGNLKANVSLGQTYVTCQWPSGISTQVLVTVGPVSEIVYPEGPSIPEVEEPEQPGGNKPEGGEPENPGQGGGNEGGEGGEPENPNPENPNPNPDGPGQEGGEGNEPEDDPVVPPTPSTSKIMYGTMPISETMTSVSAITEADVLAASLKEVDVKTMGKTLLPVKENDVVIILIPESSALKGYRDNGIGSMVAFDETLFGCNGQNTLSVSGNVYKMFIELQTVGADGYYIYIA